MALLEDPRLPPEGTILDSKYQLTRYLAQGGMGAVYEARGSSGERLAIKVMLDTSVSARESGAWARFLREAQVSSTLSSPNIVKVLGGGIDAGLGTAYLAMEFLTGEDLESLLDRVGPLHPQVAVRLILQACRGLQVAHEAGITHRDLKPANLFLEIKAGDVTVKVCDFGIAKVHPNNDQQHLTSTGHVLGSPLYMAPEQVLSSKRVDARADVWSMAMTLFHALAGKAPLAHYDTFTELVIGLTTQPIPALQEAAPWVAPGLAAVVHGGLLRDPEGRCPSIADFIRALEPHAGGSDDVTVSMLASASADLQGQQQAEITMPSSWQEALSQNRGPDPLLGKVLANKYALKRILGEGGMGAVYEAHTDQGEAFACKIIRPDLLGSPDAMRRLMREARTSMRIVSPNVVRVTEVDTDMTLGVPFIAMELLQGRDLSALVSSAGPLEPAAVCRLFIDACNGLRVAHEVGVVHRDIKPANLFLHQVGGDRDPLVVKVCDFGIAKQTDVDGMGATSTELTRTGGLLGSPLYMSPEQAKNAKSVDHRTDIWSLALSMYEALAGQKAWAGYSSPGELVLAICTQDVRPLQDIAPWIGPDLADAVHRGLRRDLAARYASVQEFAAAIEPFAAACPTLTLGALASLSSAQKQVVAERSPNSIRGVSSDESTVDAPPGPGKKQRSSLGVAVAASVITMAAAGVLWNLRTSSTDAVASLPSAAPVSTGPATPTVKVAIHVKVPVSPPGASVSVNGSPRALVDGAVELTGEPGESFAVAVEVDGQKRETQVTLSKDGKASPASLEGPPRSPRATGKIADARPAEGKGADSKGAAGKPTATAKPDQPPAQTGLGAQKDWR